MRHLLLTIAVLCAVVAVGFAADRQHIVLPRPTGNALPFSDAVKVGDTLYISGNIGLDPKTRKPGSTPEAEARLVMESVKRTLEAAGMSFDDLVQVEVFCSDLGTYEAFNGVYRSYFHEKFPARAFVGAGSLLFGARYEVMGIAIKK
jgi:2-iminobutanoate/2-iminopropanoate deaminase